MTCADQLDSDQINHPLLAQQSVNNHDEQILITLTSSVKSQYPSLLLDDGHDALVIHVLPLQEVCARQP